MNIYSKFIVRSTAVLLMCLIFGCSEKNDKSQLLGTKPIPKIEKNEVRFLGHWLGEGKKETFLREIVNEFEFTNQEIKVNMQYPEHVYFDRRIEQVEAKYNANIIAADKPLRDPYISSQTISITSHSSKVFLKKIGSSMMKRKTC